MARSVAVAVPDAPPIPAGVFDAVARALGHDDDDSRVAFQSLSPFQAEVARQLACLGALAAIERIGALVERGHKSADAERPNLPRFQSVYLSLADRGDDPLSAFRSLGDVESEVARVLARRMVFEVGRVGIGAIAERMDR